VRKYALKIVGVTPLVVHSDRLADPLDEHTQAVAEISKKRSKTLADHAEIAHREFLGGLYLDPELGPCIPSENLEKCLVEAARRHRLGKDVERGLQIEETMLQLGYDGPRHPEELWGERTRFAYRKSVGVSGRRVMRTRPMFPEWELTATLIVDESLLDESRVAQIVEEAGAYIGLCERRPKFGRFDAELDRAA
jgi:hypothetical protein